VEVEPGGVDRVAANSVEQGRVQGTAEIVGGDDVVVRI
jgi:hypothetical protein